MPTIDDGTGLLAATEGPDAPEAIGFAPSAGPIAATEGHDTAALVGVFTSVATIDAAEGPDTATIGGAGALAMAAVTERHDTPTGAAAFTPSFLSLRRALPANRPDGAAVDLSGRGTNWTSDTPFAASDLDGCSVLLQSVGSASAARLLIATGAATGTLTVTDGTLTATVTVAARPGARRWLPQPDRR